MGRTPWSAADALVRLAGQLLHRDRKGADKLSDASNSGRFSLAAKTLGFCLSALLLSSLPLFAQDRPAEHYRMRAGEARRLVENLDVLRDQRRTVTIHGPSDRGIVILPTNDGEFAIAASLTTPPGVYEIEVRAERQSFDQTARFAVTLDPPRPVPDSATRPPVILLNGYQLSSAANLGVCQASITSPHSKDTFGDLETALLQAGAPIVYFFDNCVEAPKARLEDLGAALGRTINSLTYENGSPVPRVDLVAHSMGGLIVRAYLTGLQKDGALSPPLDPKVRKLVTLATPHFGSYFAADLAAVPFFGSFLDDQAKAMLPGSAFLWNLATWNQYTDDLRGVDALALVGNKGSQPVPAAGDGVVSLTSASIGFARDMSRTRVLPYCHTESAFIDCSGPGIAKAPETASIVASFLADTADWQSASLSKAAADDPILSQYGGTYLGPQNSAGQPLSLGTVTFGGVTLSAGAAFGAWGELLRGTSTFQSSAVSCGPFTQPVGFVIVVRCKAAPAISSVGIVYREPFPAGGPIIPVRAQIAGQGFGTQQCATCKVTTTAGGSLQILSWSDTMIAAALPDQAGLLQLTVQTASGLDRIGVMQRISIDVNSITNGASFVSGFAPGGWVTIKGTGLSRTTRTWTNADFVGGNLPSVLDGVSVKINGIPAYVYFVSPGQLNVLAPSGDGDTVPSQSINVEVTSPDGVAAAAALRQRYAPAEFIVNGGYAAAVTVEGLIAAPPGTIPGLLTRAARPGDVLALYVTGMGTNTTPPVSAGRVLTSPAVLNDPVTVTVGGVNAPVMFAGLVGSGLYQINFMVPRVASGNQPVAIGITGVSGQNRGLIAVTQ